MYISWLIFFWGLWGIVGFAQEKQTDSFVLKVFERKIEISSPPVWHDHLSIIIENKTFGNLLGKVINQQGKLISFISIPKNSFQSMELTGKIAPNEQIFFVPLSPPFQEFELKIGSRHYEIPPKR